MFKNVFKKPPEKEYFSPGRINVIGEHIDYNGGFCLPIALDRGTTGYVSRNKELKFQLFSENFKNEGVHKIDFYDYSQKRTKYGWSNIFRGLICVLKKKMQNLTFGLDIIVRGTIPPSSGLSSSASLSMLLLKILNDYYELNLSTLDMVYLTKEMENNYLGAQTGILDQYVIGFAKKDSIMLLDCSEPSHKLFPLKLGKYVILVIATNKKRDLSDSKYNKRVQECQEAREILNNNGYKIKNICELKVNDLNNIEDVFRNLNKSLLFKRLKHCVTEQDRTIKASQNLSNLKLLGKLLNESHRSLRNYYEVTGEHLDYINDFSSQKDYVLGSRMTGAGFGGSGIVILQKNKLAEFKNEFTKTYFEKFKIKPTFLVVRAWNGIENVE